MAEDPIDPAMAEAVSAEPASELGSGELPAGGTRSPRSSPTFNRWVPPTPEELSRLLPQYCIESLLGQGGMGAVYKGMQPALDRPVAIKLLPSEFSADEQFVSRFRREARMLAKLHHPGIVAVYDFGQTSEGHLYFVMEYVDGTDLRHVLRSLDSKGLAPEQAFELICQICEALHSAHKQGVIHRDIKPENVLLTRDGTVKLADFGLARPLNEEDAGGLTVTNMVMGTLAYMSPEQCIGQVDQRTDIFALGIMLYEMLTGKCPRRPFLPPSRKVVVDVRIDEVVLRALEDEPDLRYQQASDMKSAVDQIRTTTVGPAAPTPPAPTSVHRLWRRPALVAGALLAILLVICWGAIVLFTHQGPTATRDRIAMQASPGTPLESGGATNTAAVFSSPDSNEISRGTYPAALNAPPRPAIATTGNSQPQQYYWSNFAGIPGEGGNADGMGNAARFNGTWDVAVDGSGNVYAGELVNNTIRKVTPGGAVTTLAGSPGIQGSADGTRNEAKFNSPQGVAVDKSGNVYVADRNNCTIRKVTPGGVVTTLAGYSGVVGDADGTGSAARFNHPEGVAVDGSRNVYVADGLNHTIRKVTPDGVVTTLAGSPGVSGNTDGIGSAARFNVPVGVAVDGSGNVYVADWVSRTIRKVTPGGVVRTLAGYPGITGTADGMGSDARFHGPREIAVDGSGNVYVADANNGTIRKVTFRRSRHNHWRYAEGNG